MLGAKTSNAELASPEKIGSQTFYRCKRSDGAHSVPYLAIFFSGVEALLTLNPGKTLTSVTHHCTEHFALRHKLKSCTVPSLYRSDLVTFRRMLYRPNVCNCTMPYVHRTVPAVCRTGPCLDSRSVL